MSKKKNAEEPADELSTTNRRLRLLLFGLVIIAFPLVVAISFLSSGTLRPSPLAFHFGGNGTGVNQIRGNITFARTSTVSFPNLILPKLPTLPSISAADLLLILGALVAIVLLLRLRFAKRRKGMVRSFEELQEERLEIATILDDTVAKLGSGRGYRETVLQCYKLISDVLEEKSKIDGRTMTAREFKREVSSILNFDSPYLERVTQLFEHARYSLDDITREEASSAAECLSKLSDLLKKSQVPLSDAGSGAMQKV